MDYFAEKPQDQENLTKEVLDYLVECIEPHAMMVVIECQHTCMSARGVKCHDAVTTTADEYGSPEAIEKIMKYLKF